MTTRSILFLTLQKQQSLRKEPKKRDREDDWDVENIYHPGRTNWEALIYVLDFIQENIMNRNVRLVPAIYKYYFTTGWETKKHLPFLESRMRQTWNS